MSRVDAAAIALPYRRAVRDEIERRGLSLRLRGLLANRDPASRKYAEWTARDCEETGIDFDLQEVPRLDLEDALLRANADPTVHGILIYYPVFGGAMDAYIRDTVALEKDVEGLSHRYRYNLYHNIRILDDEACKKSVLPCTPLGIVKILEHLDLYDRSLPPGNQLAGKQATIINRSEIVGRPLAAMLANDGADTFSVDIDSIFLHRRGDVLETKATVEEAVRGSQIVVTGVPDPSFRLPIEWIRAGAAVIDFSTLQNVDESVEKKATFVPSVGRVTIAMLERNLLRLYDNFHA